VLKFSCVEVIRPMWYSSVALFLLSWHLLPTCAEECGDESETCSSGLAAPVDNFMELSITVTGEPDEKLGLSPAAWPPEDVYIEGVRRDSLAEKAGFQKHDLITEANSRLVSGMSKDEMQAELQVRPLVLKVQRLRPLGTANESAILERLRGQRCYIGAGGEFAWSPQTMRLEEAYALCKRTPECRGFTSSTGKSFTLTQRYGFHFKTKFECFRNEDWVAFAMFAEDVEDNIGPNLPFVAPDLEALRGQPNVTFLSEVPPVIQFDGFLSDAEIEHILQKAEPRLQRSTVGIEAAKDTRRTSSTAWFDQPEDLKDPVMVALDARIEQLTNIPRRNMEHHQVLRYDVGEHYVEHNDFIIEQRDKPCGPRLATFFMYLADVEEGGGTKFKHLDIEVRPVKGRGLLWWNLNFTQLQSGKDPLTMGEDHRLYHASLPVVNGTKWAVNKWLHLKDFLNNHRLGHL